MPDTCVVKGCTRSVKALGFCGAHYKQHRSGNVRPEIRARAPNDSPLDRKMLTPTRVSTKTAEVLAFEAERRKTSVYHLQALILEAWARGDFLTPPGE